MSGELVSARDLGWERLKALALDPLTSIHSKRAYGKALDEFQRWCTADGAGFSKATVQRYKAELEARGLAPSSVNIQLAAIRRLALEAGDNGLIDAQLAGAIGRVKGAKRHGVRTGNWLTQSQAEEMLALPDTGTLAGKRNRAILAVLVGCGVRRDELASLTVEHMQQRDARWVLVDLIGKGKRVRTVPMPSWAKAACDAWTAAAGYSSGPLFRRISARGNRIGNRALAPESIYDVVQRYGRQIGVRLAPHDLRRSFAKLAHSGHAALEQIQIALGHSSIQTTERYLGVRQDLVDAPCDRLGLKL
jgi:site-specific recombinase XerD